MVVSEGVRVNENGRLCFGNYASKEKIKVEGFEHNGDMYKLKTCSELPRLEKNGRLLVETLPGAVLHDFSASSEGVFFRAEALGDASFTLGLLPATEYKVAVNGDILCVMKSTSAGKFVFSAALDEKGAEIAVTSRAL